jgi:hypothetical protein
MSHEPQLDITLGSAAAGLLASGRIGLAGAGRGRSLSADRARRPRRGWRPGVGRAGTTGGVRVSGEQRVDRASRRDPRAGGGVSWRASGPVNQRRRRRRRAGSYQRVAVPVVPAT